jgi:A/G-specific adenine glycosylase
VDERRGELRTALLAWYEPRRAIYPWRRQPNPYRTLVSEVMLQQTQAARVAPAFERFVARFPDVGALARASKADVLRAWEGLGYNRRAIALSDAARAIAAHHGGAVPEDPAALRTLPGVGPYTAAAVAAIGHGAGVAAVDVNVRRVVTRVAFGADPSAATPSAVDGEAARLLDRDNPGPWTEALMDLGREVCRPAPRCEACPIATWCAWLTAGAGSNPPVQHDRRGRPRPGRFEGSFRQVRGGVLGRLRRGPATIQQLSAALARNAADVSRAVAALEAEGAIERAPDGPLIRLAESDLSPVAPSVRSTTASAPPGTGVASGSP